MSEDSLATAVLKLAVARGLLPAPEPGQPSLFQDTELRPSQLLTKLLSQGQLTLNEVNALRNAVVDALATHDGPSAAPCAPAADAEPPFFDFANERYRIEEFIGHGGMGRVYRAYDTKLERPVALKFLHFADDGTRQRFFREARAQARIIHPNVCQVYDVGQHHGQLYIAMEFISGESLRKARGQLSLDEKVLLIKQVAEALQAAHRLGIIHRDIKSSNVLAAKMEGEAWRAVLLDFGLARDLESPEQMTKSDAMMGTPAYMSPEQARADNSRVDRRTDLYSTGALMYEMLTGVPPFLGSTESTIWQVLHEDPLPPRRRDPSIPIDLEIIALKCLHKEPQHRYESAQKLADDLERYLSGQPILARKISLAYRVRRLVRRHWGLFSLGFLALFSAALLIGTSVRGQRQAERRARLAQHLGREIELSDMFLRMIYSLPLHDVRREESVVRARIARMQSQLLSMPPREASLAHYAVGKSLLILRDYTQAISHLRAATAQGLAEPEVHQSLGHALAARYHQALSEIDFGVQDTWLKQRQQQLYNEFLAPARSHLERGRADQSSEALLNQAILSLYREEYEQALRNAREVLSVEPWRSEAKKVTGDVEAAVSSRFRQHNQTAQARSALERALVQYRAALEMSRSDPTYHLAVTQSYMHRMLLDVQEGKSPQDSFEKCLQASEQLQVVLPDSIPARHFRAQAYIIMIRQQIEHGRAANEYAAAAISDLQYIAQREPHSPQLSHALSLVYIMALESRIRRGEPLEDLPARTEQVARKAAEQQENPVHAYRILGDLYALLAYQRFIQSEDPTSFLLKSRDSYKLGIARSRDYVGLYESLLTLYGQSLDRLEQFGFPVEDWAKEAVSLAEQGLLQQPSSFFLQQNLGRAYAVQAEIALSRQRDPSELLDQGERHLDEALKLQPTYVPTHYELSHLYQLRAKLALQRGQDAEPLLARARAALEHGIKGNAQDSAAQLLSAKLLLLSAELALQRGHTPMPTLAELARLLAPLEDPGPEQAEAALLDAQGALLLGRWLHGPLQRAALQKGLNTIARSLALRPKWPLAHAVKQALEEAFALGSHPRR